MSEFLLVLESCLRSFVRFRVRLTLTRGSMQFKENLVYFQKNSITVILGSLEMSRHADRFCLLTRRDPTIRNLSSGPFLHWTHLRANQSFSSPFSLSKD